MPEILFSSKPIATITNTEFLNPQDIDWLKNQLEPFDMFDTVVPSQVKPVVQVATVGITQSAQNEATVNVTQSVQEKENLWVEQCNGKFSVYPQISSHLAKEQRLKREAEAEFYEDLQKALIDRNVPTLSDAVVVQLSKYSNNVGSYGFTHEGEPVFVPFPKPIDSADYKEWKTKHKEWNEKLDVLEKDQVDLFRKLVELERMKVNVN